jgi:DNA polymerase-4
VTLVLYAEVPAFYAEVERAADPALRDRPVLVGGDPRRRGLVQSATADAVAAGVREGMLMLDALALCPRGRALRTDMRRYREAANRLRQCLRGFAARLEMVGQSGAAFLELREGDGDPEQLGRALRRAALAELSLPLRVGIAPVRFVARLAAEEAGPDGVRRVPNAQVGSFLGPLPVARLPGVGPHSAERLAGIGVRTVSELAALDPARVQDVLGKHGLTLLEHARGRGEARVRDQGSARSLSLECTLEADERDRSVLEERLHKLAQGLEQGLAREHAAARRITLKLRYGDAPETVTRSRTGPRAVESAAEIGRAAAELLGDTDAGERPVRLVGITLGQLLPSARDERQLDLFRTP